MKYEIIKMARILKDAQNCQMHKTPNEILKKSTSRLSYIIFTTQK